MSTYKPESEDLKCVYCGEPATTKDHIPPRNLFRILPHNLITVPACLNCNNDSSKDDEFFRAVLLSDDRIQGHPNAQQLIQTFNRSLARPTGFGVLIDKVRRSFSLISPQGIIYGTGTGLETDFIRESKVLTRIMKGLFYHELQRPHPENNSISVFSTKNIGPGSENLATVLEMIGYIKNENKRTIDIFSYGWAVAEDHPDATFWILTFYKTFPFFIFSVPPIPRLK
jgi:hypothetical protein